MLFSANFKPWECCSRDASRPVLTLVHLTVKTRMVANPTKGAPELELTEGWLEATDSYALVRIPCELESGDVAGFVPVAALKAAAKLAGKDRPARVACNGACELADGSSYPRPDAGQFPNFEQLMPEKGNAAELEPFGINPAVLANVHKAFGGSGVKVDCSRGVLRPFVVEPIGCKPAPRGMTEDSRGAIGLVMPVRLSL